MENDKVYCTCYGDRMEFESSEKAMDFFMQGMMACEGSERDRYTNIYCQLKNGQTKCFDEI